MWSLGVGWVPLCNAVGFPTESLHRRNSKKCALAWLSVIIQNWLADLNEFILCACACVRWVREADCFRLYLLSGWIIRPRLELIALNNLSTSNTIQLFRLALGARRRREPRKTRWRPSILPQLSWLWRDQQRRLKIEAEEWKGSTKAYEFSRGFFF